MKERATALSVARVADPGHPNPDLSQRSCQELRSIILSQGPLTDTASTCAYATDVRGANFMARALDEAGAAGDLTDR
jgi:hypothetical protein